MEYQTRLGWEEGGNSWGEKICKHLGCIEQAREPARDSEIGRVGYRVREGNVV